MRMMITAQGADINSQVNSQFGRSPYFVFFETDDEMLEHYQALPNPALSASAGAGIQAAQLVVDQGAQAVITGNVGPNAMQVLRAADVAVYSIPSADDTPRWTLREAVEAFKAGRLSRIALPTTGKGGPAAPQHSERTQKIAALQRKAQELRQELAHILDQIDELEKE